jgi:hypothetical protein
MPMNIRIICRFEVKSHTCREVECRKCEYAEDLKGCAAKHVCEARRLISKGNPEGADLQLNYLEKHLKE